MTIWSGEIKELDKLYVSFKGHLPEIVKEMEQLIKTEDPNVVMLYSRRCLEVIITDLCESELNRPRKTEPLKGIIDKLNSEEKVPSHIITSMISLNSMANYGAHPKDFDPEQVKPVLNNLAIIVKWYLKYKDFKIVSANEPIVKKEVTSEKKKQVYIGNKLQSLKKKKIFFISGLVLVLSLIVFAVFTFTGLNTGKSVNYLDSAGNLVYKEVIIGDQIWMAENLATTTFNDGRPIALVTNKTDWANSDNPAYCWYNNNALKFKNSPYGALYNYHAVNTGKLCPIGWRVPTAAELEILFDFKGNDNAGEILKETGSRYWRSSNRYATNESGFTAVGGGNRNMYGPFNDRKKEGYWWSSSENNEIGAISFILFSGASNGLSTPMHKQFGMSVRCIKNPPVVWDIPISDYDNNNYKTVKIGDQVWMAENLKTSKLNDGTPIPMVTGDTLLWNYFTRVPSYSWIGDSETAYNETYGKLYNWYAVNTGKLCPTGWHVPSDGEWTTLEEYLGGEAVAGGKLKEHSVEFWISPNIGATNETGFSALPGGFGHGNNYEGERGANFQYGGYFWSSTSEDTDAHLTEDNVSNIAWGRELYTFEKNIERYIQGKSNGMSVRCIKDM